MSKTPQYDVKVKKILDQLKSGDEQVCPLSGKTWVLDDKELEICHRFNVPPSKVEPKLRLDYLNAFNTGLSIWWKEDVNGEVILSSTHSDSPFEVMKEEEWQMSDFIDRAQDYDSERAVIDQLWDLRLKIPESATRSTSCENTIGVASYKCVDSYMACGSMVNRCHYTYTMVNGEDSVDVANGEEAIRSFFVGGSQKIVDCEYVLESSECLNSSFLFDCHNCEFCFGTTNKRYKKYLWFNKQLSETEWKQRREKVDLGCRSQADEYYQKFISLIQEQAVWPECFSVGNQDGEGEHVLGCTRCQDCYWVLRSTDLYRCRFGMENEGCAYVSGPGWAKNGYLTTGSTYSNGVKFCMAGYSMINCEYCAMCLDCENCFGCFGLKKKRWHIFNKSYSEEDYWTTVDQIKCQMLEEGSYGEFWPAKFCLHGFKNSIGELYFGYDLEDLKKWGATVYDQNQGLVLAPKQLGRDSEAVSEIPDCIDQIDPERFVGVPIHDSKLDREFSVIKSEFEIYKKKRWPFPRQHFISRLTDLIRHSNSPHKEYRQCDSCQVDIVTYKNLKFPERKVYCRECYLKYLEQNG
ncbi:MAG: hypothetical protein ABIH67_02750 [Candidatus Uhrbacteria bacterium]